MPKYRRKRLLDCTKAFINKNVKNPRKIGGLPAFIVFIICSAIVELCGTNCLKHL